MLCPMPRGRDTSQDPLRSIEFRVGDRLTEWNGLTQRDEVEHSISAFSPGYDDGDTPFATLATYKSLPHADRELHVQEDVGGQQRWAGSSFDEQNPPKVEWLGMRDDVGTKRQRAEVLRTMMGGIVAETREIPTADSALSPQGSRIAKAMSRRFGIKGHEANPHMEPTWALGGNEWDEELYPDAVAEMNQEYDFGGRTLSPDEVQTARSMFPRKSYRKPPEPPVQPMLPGMSGHRVI